MEVHTTQQALQRMKQYALGSATCIALLTYQPRFLSCGGSFTQPASLLVADCRTQGRLHKLQLQQHTWLDHEVEV